MPLLSGVLYTVFPKCIKSLYGDQRSFPSADDYYQAVGDYQQWLKDKEEAEAEAADLAYERHLEEKWDK